MEILRLATTSAWSANVPHLLLLEVTDGLNGQFAFDWGGGVARFQLDDGLGSLVQARHHRLEFIQLFSLLLLSIDMKKKKKPTTKQKIVSSDEVTPATCPTV